MAEYLKEAAKQVPSLTVLCIVVYIFIGHLTGRDAIFIGHLNNRDETIERLFDSCNQHNIAIYERVEAMQRETNESIKEATRAIGAATNLLNNSNRAIERN